MLDAAGGTLRVITVAPELPGGIRACASGGCRRRRGGGRPQRRGSRGRGRLRCRCVARHPSVQRDAALASPRAGAGRGRARAGRRRLRADQRRDPPARRDGQGRLRGRGPRAHRARHRCDRRRRDRRQGPRLGAAAVHVRGGAARLADGQTLAGSMLTMDRAFRRRFGSWGCRSRMPSMPRRRRRLASSASRTGSDPSRPAATPISLS